MIAGALLFPFVARIVTPRIALIGASLLVALGFLMFLPFHTAYAELITNMVIAGLGSGALVAALPAAAASAAPSTQTGVATGLTNSVKTVGGAVASCVFGIALHARGSRRRRIRTRPQPDRFSGYVTVWVVCGITALAAAVLLLFVPKQAFTDRTGHAADEPAAEPTAGDVA